MLFGSILDTIDDDLCYFGRIDGRILACDVEEEDEFNDPNTNKNDDVLAEDITN